MKNAVGRPTIYTEELADEICTAIGTHALSVADLCSMHPHWPDPQTLRRWLLEERGNFRAKYERAKEWQAEITADECIKIADYEAQDLIENEKGILVGNSVKVARDKLRIDTRKWFSSQLRPKKYGRQIVTVGVEGSLMEKIIDKL